MGSEHTPHRTALLEAIHTELDAREQVAMLLSWSPSLEHQDHAWNVDEKRQLLHAARAQLQQSRLRDRTVHELVQLAWREVDRPGLYGRDDRQDICELECEATHRANLGMDSSHFNTIIEHSRSVACAVPMNRLKPDGEHYTLKRNLFAEVDRLCEGVRYAHQLTLGKGTAFVIDEQHFITAGHVAKHHKPPERPLAFVFDFRVPRIGVPTSTRIPASNVFVAKAVTKTSSGPEDWAIVQVNRVIDRPPLPRRTEDRIEHDAPLYILGHPFALPLKFAGGATVQDNAPDTHFLANLDAYSGNSGSPVLHRHTHEVEGILTHGLRGLRLVYNGPCECKAAVPSFSNMLGRERVARILGPL